MTPNPEQSERLLALAIWREAFEEANLSDPTCDDENCIDCRAAASVISDALQKAREEERAAVVAWLRNDASAAWGQACDGMEEMSWCIEAIERGEHRREG